MWITNQNGRKKSSTMCALGVIITRTPTNGKWVIANERQERAPQRKGRSALGHIYRSGEMRITNYNGRKKSWTVCALGVIPSFRSATV